MLQNVKKALLNLIVILILVIFLPLRVQGIQADPSSRIKTLSIACDGSNDQLKINSAISSLPPTGGTVALPSRQCNLASSINITRDNVTLQGQGASTILYLNNNANTNVINATNKNNIYIKNLKINGNKSHQTPRDGIGLGIKLEGISRGGVENVEVYDTSWHGISFGTPLNPVNPEIVIRNVRVQDSGFRRTGGSGMGIAVGNVPQNTTIENNTIVNSLQTGIFIRIQGNAKNIRIQGNTAQNIQGNGIHVSCDSGSLDNLWILNNTVSGMHDTQHPFGIWTPGPACDNAQKYIQNNRVLPDGPGISAPADHFGLSGNNGILTGNYSEGSFSDGYAFGNIGLTLSNWTIRDNQAINNGAQGFMIYRMRNSTIANNTASGNSQDGIRLNAGWDNIVENNTVYNNGWRGIILYGTHERDPLREGDLRNTLRNNRVYNNQGAEIQERSLGDYNTFICNNVENNDIRLVGPHSRILPCVSPTPTPTLRPTITPTPRPSPQVTSVSFNGQNLDLTGRTITPIRLTSANPIAVPVIIRYNTLPTRYLIIRFNYQPPVTPSPSPSPTPTPSPVSSYEGIIQKLEASIYQQGTHRLVPTVSAGSKVLILQSKTINLNLYLGKTVKIQGSITSLPNGEGILIEVTSLSVITPGAKINL